MLLLTVMPPKRAKRKSRPLIGMIEPEAKKVAKVDTHGTGNGSAILWWQIPRAVRLFLWLL